MGPRGLSRLVLAVVLAGILATPALGAAPAVTGGTIEVAAGSTLVYGGAATFDVTIEGRLPSRQSLRIWVRCYQGSEWVWQQTGSPAATFVLGNGAGPWQGGAANCTADLMLETFKAHALVARETLDQAAFAVGG